MEFHEKSFYNQRKTLSLQLSRCTLSDIMNIIRYWHCDGAPIAVKYLVSLSKDGGVLKEKHSLPVRPDASIKTPAYLKLIFCRNIKFTGVEERSEIFRHFEQTTVSNFIYVNRCLKYLVLRVLILQSTDCVVF